MRAILLLGALCFPHIGWAQVLFSSSGGAGGNGSYSTTGNGRILGGSGPLQGLQSVGSLDASLRVDTGTSGPPGAISFSYSGHSTADVTYFTRTFTDSVNRQIFGYEVLLEQQQPGTYLATFGKISMTPKAAADVGKGWRDWSVREVQLPEPKLVHDGDVIIVELMTDAASGFRLADDITIKPNAPPNPIRLAQPQRLGIVSGLARGGGPGAAVPTVSGQARDFIAADAEMQIRQPRITINGDTDQGVATPGVNGSLIWLYLPGHGRYILSLAPRPELKFKAAGEVRGGAAKFTLLNDTISIECPQAIATGHAPYTLYVLFDPLWVPTSSRQKGQAALGSVDAGELEQLEVQ